MNRTHCALYTLSHPHTLFGAKISGVSIGPKKGWGVKLFFIFFNTLQEPKYTNAPMHSLRSQQNGGSLLGQKGGVIFNILVFFFFFCLHFTRVKLYILCTDTYTCDPIILKCALIYAIHVFNYSDDLASQSLSSSLSSSPSIVIYPPPLIPPPTFRYLS